MKRTAKLMLLLIMFLIGLISFSVIFIRMTYAARDTLKQEMIDERRLEVDLVCDLIEAMPGICPELTTRNLTDILYSYLKGLDSLPYSYAAVFDESLTQATVLSSKLSSAFNPANDPAFRRAVEINPRGGMETVAAGDSGGITPAYLYYRWISDRAFDGRTLVVTVITDHSMRMDLFTDMINAVVMMFGLVVTMCLSLSMVTYTLGRSGDTVGPPAPCVYCGRNPLGGNITASNRGGVRVMADGDIYENIQPIDDSE